MFNSLFSGSTVSDTTVYQFVICLIISLGLGLVISLVHMFKSTYSKSFIITLALLPAAVSAVILMVNGNLGAGVAVAGAFSLVRFRSAPGTAKEICAIFLAMASGLIVGMGYIAFAVLFVAIMCVVNLIYTASGFGGKKRSKLSRDIRITIPENLDYTNVFDDIFSEYTSDYTLKSVKTTNMGSMFKLSYSLTLNDESCEKEFIDSIRCRNGNLEIVISRQESDELNGI